MIILDTQIGVWWVHGDAHLPNHYRTYLEGHETQGLGVSVISCWEVAKLRGEYRSAHPPMSGGRMAGSGISLSRHPFARTHATDHCGIYAVTRDVSSVIPPIN